MSAICFYTSCTLTKSLPVATSLSAASLTRNSVKRRTEQWHARIDAWKGTRRTARELYCGGHWSVVRKLAESHGADGLESFVISAGYGLVSIETELAPYAATFTLGQADSVAIGNGKVGPTENVAWWNRLCDWRPTGVTGIRSITDMVRKWPRRVHLMALSPAYLDAISEDLSRALKCLKHRQSLIIISTGKKRHGELNQNVVSAPAELQMLLGGALTSLNVRLAAKLINSLRVTDLSLDNVQEFIGRLRSNAGPRKQIKRKIMEDAEVVRFIKTAIKSETIPSYTQTLRILRDSGHACEMKRFRELFRNTVHS